MENSIKVASLSIKLGSLQIRDSLCNQYDYLVKHDH